MEGGDAYVGDWRFDRQHGQGVLTTSDGDKYTGTSSLSYPLSFLFFFFFSLFLPFSSLLVLFCFVLFCFVLFCFVLFCFVLFCFVLFRFVSFHFVSFCFILPYHI